MRVCDWCGEPEGRYKIKSVPTHIDASNSPGPGGVYTSEELCTRCRQAINRAIRNLKDDREVIHYGSTKLDKNGDKDTGRGSTA